MCNIAWLSIVPQSVLCFLLPVDGCSESQIRPRPEPCLPSLQRPGQGHPNFHERQAFYSILSGATKLSAAVMEVSLIITPMGPVVSDVGGGVVLLTVAVLSATSTALSLPFPQAVKKPDVARAIKIIFIWICFLSESCYPYTNGCLPCRKGCVYSRLPVALYMALASAAKIGGNNGSPRPVGSCSFFTKCTSMAFGASLCRIMR